jgi:8-oxo-dGTP pyrophosphatase MutT (NUDIX family)
MGHIHTKPYQHDITASGYIIRLDGDEPRIMLHHHRALNALMQFGGHVELDEHPWEAVAREVREEAGYDLDQLQVMQQRDRIVQLSDAILLPQPLFIVNVTYGDKLPNHFHDDIAWAFVTHETPRHTIGSDESQELMLLSRSQVMGAEGDRMFGNVRDAAIFIFDTCLPNWEAVPTEPLSREG